MVSQLCGGRQWPGHGTMVGGRSYFGLHTNCHVPQVPVTWGITEPAAASGARITHEPGVIYRYTVGIYCRVGIYDIDI